MRTLRNLAVPQDGDDIKFPDGQIRNETAVQTGTPVVRELYGDVITNIYAILRDAGIIPTETEDSSTNQYQLVDALKVFANKLNDLEQLLTVNTTDINSTIDFDSLPANYVFIGKITEDILASESYTIVGTGANSYPVTLSKNIPASSLVLVVLNAGGTKIIAIGSEGSLEDSIVNTSFGNPLSFNESSEMLYISNGVLFNHNPKAYLVENIIQVSEGNANIKIVDAVLLKGKLVCFTVDTLALKYQAFSFDSSDFSTLEGEITLDDAAGVDNQPYMYCDGEFLYFTNTTDTVNGTIDDYSIGKFSFNETTLVITSVSFNEVDTNFEKTTNVFIDFNTDVLYTFITGELYRYPLGGGARSLLDTFNTLNGIVFKFNGSTYYSNGEIGTKWSL